MHVENFMVKPKPIYLSRCDGNEAAVSHSFIVMAKKANNKTSP